MAKKVATKEPAQKSATRALADLQAGNERFAKDKFNNPQLDSSLRNEKRRQELTKGQKPWAVILSCADSRVPPELIFDCGLGELFVIRVAGNIANSESIASIEYAVHKPYGIGANLVVVLGHEGCGAVKAAIDSAAAPAPLDLGQHLNGLLSNITPAVSQLSPKRINEFNNKGISDRKKNGTLNSAVEANALNSIATLEGQSATIREEKGVLVVPAIYRLATGKVEFFEA